MPNGTNVIDVERHEIIKNMIRCMRNATVKTTLTALGDIVEIKLSMSST